MALALANIRYLVSIFVQTSIWLSYVNIRTFAITYHINISLVVKATVVNCLYCRLWIGAMFLPIRPDSLAELLSVNTVQLLLNASSHFFSVNERLTHLELMLHLACSDIGVDAWQTPPHCDHFLFVSFRQKPFYLTPGRSLFLKLYILIVFFSFPQFYNIAPCLRFDVVFHPMVKFNLARKTCGDHEKSCLLLPCSPNTVLSRAKGNAT
jgi:hypothetical protein